MNLMMPIPMDWQKLFDRRDWEINEKLDNLKKREKPTSTSVF
jgi:hypothetical protein